MSVRWIFYLFHKNFEKKGGVFFLTLPLNKKPVIHLKIQFNSHLLIFKGKVKLTLPLTLPYFFIYIFYYFVDLPFLKNLMYIFVH